MTSAKATRAQQAAPDGQPRSRFERVLGYDGVISTLLRSTAQHFLVSVAFVACLLPTLVFHALVGWQSSHLSIWLGALALLPVFPAVTGLVAAAGELRAEGADSRAGRVFWRAFGHAVRRLWWMAVALSLVVVIVGYDLALLGSSDVVFVIAVIAIIAAATIGVGVAVVSLDDEVPRRPLALLAAALGRMARRPHVPLVWLLIMGLTGAATAIPLVGALVWLFGPALAGRAVVFCNAALGFTRVARA